MSDVNHEQLRSLIERIEAINQEIDERTADRKEIFAEARGNGFDVKIMRRVIALRKQDADKRREQEEILHLYLAAIGFDSTPLGASARKAA